MYWTWKYLHYPRAMLWLITKVFIDLLCLQHITSSSSVVYILKYYNTYNTYHVHTYMHMVKSNYLFLYKSNL